MFKKLKLALATLAVMVTSVAQAGTVYVDRPYPVVTPVNGVTCLIQPANNYIINRSFISRVSIEGVFVRISIPGNYDIVLELETAQKARNWATTVLPRLPCLK